MSRDIWVISDTHFGHENIIRYCNRPFANAKEADQKMVENWNSVVKDNDIVYHLGDVYFGIDGVESLRKLNGRKRLILGNHDNGKDQYLQRAFQKIMMWRMFPEFGLLLTHVPVHQSSLKIYEAEDENSCGSVQKQFVNIHGHIHQNESPSELHRNVSVEKINYTPINIEELRVK